MVATLPFLVLAAIANVATTIHAFVPCTATGRCANSQRIWPRAVPTAVAIPASRDSATASAAAASSGDETKTSTGFWDRLESLLLAPLDIPAETGSGSDEEDDPRLLLAEWENVWEETTQDIFLDDTDNDNHNHNDEPGNHRNATAATRAAVESMTNFLEVWAQITLQNDKGLTTPVSATKFKPHELVAAETCGDDEQHCSSSSSKSSSSMKLVFRPPKRYLSYKEQKSMEKNGVLPDRKGAKVDAWSPGGVEIQVTTTTTTTTTTTRIVPALARAAAAAPHEKRQTRRSVVGVAARRCDVDGDTVVKKTSERAIVRRLENAIRVWRKSSETGDRR